MQILVINSGSSSIKFSFFDAEEGEPQAESEPRALFEGEVSGIGGAEAKVTFRDMTESTEGVDLLASDTVKSSSFRSIPDAIAKVEELVNGPRMPKIEAVGYRVVHPGAHLREHVAITDAVMKQLNEAVAFAPLHDPTAITIIEEMRRRFPQAKHFACFDTVFHETMPEEATAYPLPQEYAKKGARRYGFHGLSCESVVYQLQKALIAVPHRMAIAHLGSGCSVTALVGGTSVDTSMGLTPTGGVVMGTRPGDLDPGLLLWLVRQESVDAVEQMLNHKAGLAGLSGISGDLREVQKAAGEGNTQARLSLAVFTRSVRKQLGAYLGLLGGLDAVVFSGGIGEHDATTRAEVLGGWESLGITLDTSRNEQKADRLRKVSAEGLATAVYIVPAEEDLMIARHVTQMSRTTQ